MGQMKKTNRFLELLRFIVCGATAAIADYLACQLVVLLFGLGNVNPFVVTIVSTAAGFLVGLLVNYVISIIWVYQNVDKSVKTKSIKFILLFSLLSLIGMLISMGTMALCNLVVSASFNGMSIVDFSVFELIKEKGIKFLAEGIFWAYIVSFIIKTLTGFIWNYFTRKYILFKEPKPELDIDTIKSSPITIKKLSIIIPCYNEEKDAKEKIEIVKNYVTKFPVETEILAVNDGSKDNTKEVLSSIEGIKALSYDVNKGKGGAVKYGIENASGDYILFMDADLSTDLSALDITLPLCGNNDVIIGSRHMKQSSIPIKQPALRRFIGRGCRAYVNAMFHTKYKDTQCGYKAFKADIAKQICNLQIINGFAFDVEYLYIAGLNKCSIIEIPIIWKDDRGSTVNPVKSSTQFFKDVIKIKKNKKNYIFNKKEKED